MQYEVNALCKMQNRLQIKPKNNSNGFYAIIYFESSKWNKLKRAEFLETPDLFDTLGNVLSGHKWLISVIVKWFHKTLYLFRMKSLKFQLIWPNSMNFKTLNQMVYFNAKSVNKS